VNKLEWWAQGHTFHTAMRVLDIAAYDAILGYDWLSSHSPMVCHWGFKTLQFQEQGKQVHLQGIQAEQLSVGTLSPEQFIKLHKGNDIWALAIVQLCATEQQSVVSPSISAVLGELQDVFQDPSEPPHREYDHSIPLLPGAMPVNSRPYKYSPLHKDEIERQVKSLLQSGLITPSSSPFASPVLLVQKKDGSWRFCVDYRRLNNITVKNKFPMPLIDEILDELQGARYFSRLDFRSGFHQVRMNPADEHKTTFKTHHGHYQFKVMFFGLTNAPATFQCTMNSILEPYLRKSVIVFMDDILVYSNSLEDHVQHLREVLTLLRSHKFFVKLSKCAFAQEELEYLGHIILGAGVATDPRKIQAMLDWPAPLYVTKLRGFLGLTGYYRKFVKHYGTLAKPLTNLLKKKQFAWDQTTQKAFQSLKTAMSTTPVLALPNFSKQFIVETDALDMGLGAVLMQDDRPIAFLSKPLSANNKFLSIYKKYFLALIMAVDRWCPYLQRQEFIIKTDQ
jgi:hypothetical protein